MAYLSSPALGVVVSFPLSSALEVRDRASAAVNAGRAWPLQGEEGGFLLVNLSVLSLVFVTEEMPARAADCPVVTVAPVWSAPDEIPDLWSELEPSTDGPT